MPPSLYCYLQEALTSPSPVYSTHTPLQLGLGIDQDKFYSLATMYVCK